MTDRGRVRMGKRPRWEVRVYLDADLFYHSYALAGLHNLASDGVVALQERAGWQSPLRAKTHEFAALLLEVRPYGHDRWTAVAYDVADRSDQFCRATLCAVDLYF